MTQETIDRLKALLFEKESRDLDQLARQLDEQEERGRRDRDSLARRLGEIEARVGGEAQLTASVAQIVDKAIYQAEAGLEKTAPLTEAMAPMVVRTLRTELASKHTADQIAGLLSPRIGEMITKYVSYRMQEVMDRINRSVGQNAFLLRVRSIASGRSVAELGLADSERLEVEEIYLIRRGSGELVHHWSREVGPDMQARAGNRDAVVSGMLTALSSFVEEAFEADKARLRSLDLDARDLDDRNIFLAGSPAHLVALKCKGTATRAILGLLDAEALALLERHQQVEERRLRAPGGEREAAEARADAEHEQILAATATRLPERIAEREREIKRARMFRQLRILLWAIAVPLAITIGWQLWVGWRVRELQAKVDAVLPAELKGLVRARVDRSRTVWIGGVAPDEEARRKVLAAVEAAVPGISVVASMGVLPREDVGGAVRAAVLAAAIDRAGLKLDQVAGDLGRVAGGIERAEDRAAVEAAEQQVRDVAGRIRSAAPGPDGGALRDGLDAATRALAAAGDRLAGLVSAETAAPGAAPIGSAAPSDPPPPSPAAPGAASETTSSAERLTHAAERVSRLVATLESLQAAARERTRLAAELEATRAAAAAERARLDAHLADLSGRIAALAPKPPTPRQRLETLLRENAVFFSNATDYRDAAAVAAFLDEAARLIIATDLLVRVVGYTDDTGGQQRNAPLSQSRADKVAAELIQRGVPRARLVAVGRATALDLSPRAGAESTNRRVELEIGFAGERLAPERSTP